MYQLKLKFYLFPSAEKVQFYIHLTYDEFMYIYIGNFKNCREEKSESLTEVKEELERNNVIISKLKSEVLIIFNVKY